VLRKAAVTTTSIKVRFNLYSILRLIMFVKKSGTEHLLSEPSYNMNWLFNLRDRLSSFGEKKRRRSSQHVDSGSDGMYMDNISRPM